MELGKLNGNAALRGAQAAQGSAATRSNASQALSGAQAAQAAEALRDSLSQALSGAQAAQNVEAQRAEQVGTQDQGLSGKAIDACNECGDNGRAQSLADAVSNAFSGGGSESKANSSEGSRSKSSSDSGGQAGGGKK